MSNITIKRLFVYPVKGLSSHCLQQAQLQAGQGIPGDRAFALMFDLDASRESVIVPWMKKQNFAMQCDWPGLAALNCQYDPQTSVLTVKRDSIELLVAETNTESGRDRINAFFTGYLAAIYPTQSARHPDRTPLHLVGDGKGTSYPDRELGHLSLVSQATLDQLSVTVGKAIDVRRFRPNIVVEGVSAWGEFDWVGQQIQLGTAQLEITAPINRCLNIDVNPDTGERDIPLFSLLQKHFKHKQTGVLAKVISSGAANLGDSLIF